MRAGVLSAGLFVNVSPSLADAAAPDYFIDAAASILTAKRIAIVCEGLSLDIDKRIDVTVRIYEMLEADGYGIDDDVLVSEVTRQAIRQTSRVMFDAIRRRHDGEICQIAKQHKESAVGALLGAADAP